MNKPYELIEKVENRKPLTSQEKKKLIRYLMTDNHTAKMKDVISVNTSCLCNSYCMVRHENPKLICNDCFSEALHNQYKALAEKLRIATIFYTEYTINPEDVPKLNTKWEIVRFESFGDLQSIRQLENYYTIAKVFGLPCALWTKNPWFANLTTIEKPKNLVIIYSEPKKDKVWNAEEFKVFKTKYPAIDKVFIVCTGEYIENNGVNVNCGARSCFTCRRCYKKTTAKVIIERLKADAKKKRG